MPTCRGSQSMGIACSVCKKHDGSKKGYYKTTGQDTELRRFRDEDQPGKLPGDVSVAGQGGDVSEIC